MHGEKAAGKEASLLRVALEKYSPAPVTGQVDGRFQPVLARKPGSLALGNIQVQHGSGWSRTNASPAAELLGFRFDTALPGNGRGGYLYGTEPKPAQKNDLLECLKTL